MKKQFLWLALGASALTACTSTDVIEEGPQSNVIGFENVVKKSTRATDLTTTDFDKFLVYGYYTADGQENHPIWVFNGDEVKKTTTATTNEGGESVNVTTWTYTNTRYWNPGCTYYFYAYSCQDIPINQDLYGKVVFPVYSTPLDQLSSTLDDRGLKIENYICNAEHQHDLVTAYAEGQVGKRDTNTPVKFSFRHALCKVCFEFVNGLPTGPGYSIEVSDVKMSNFQDVASLNVRQNNGSSADYTVYPENDPRKNHIIWYGQGRVDNGTPVIELPNAKVNGEVTNTTESVFMIPARYDDANVAFEFRLIVKQGNDIFLDRKLKGTWKPKWEAGTAYKYLVTINGENAQLMPIVFEATQDLNEGGTWSGNTPADMTFSINDSSPEAPTPGADTPTDGDQTTD